uniref:Reverse transcriptase domain-containing protein n=1 Tax=Tanacetum cinerariifolium TaxID=118510 RepID=A0A699GXJ4_TANCI|nr:hypothetical protein [Tanacetum cinerariifolium]
MLKQLEQAANLVVQKEQEEHAAQSFTPYWKFSMIDDEEVLQSISTRGDSRLMCKLLEDVRNISEELAEYINSPSWNHPTFYNDDEEHYIQYKEYLENSSNAITPILPTEEPEYSLSMGYEHLSTISETESDEVIKFSVEKLVPILSEYEVTSDNESECDVPVCEDSFDVLKDHPEILSDCNNDDISSDDDAFEDIEYVEASELVSLEGENDVYQEEKEFNLEYILQIQDVILREKLLSINRLIADIELLNDNPTPDRVLKSSSSFPIFEKSEVDLYLASDNSIPPGIENIDYDSEGDIHFLEELLVNDSIPLPKNESSNFDRHDDPLFLRPHPKPPNVEVFFDFEPNSGELISVVKNNIDEFNEDECFDPEGGEIDVFANIKDDDYFPFIFVIRIFLPYLIYPEISPLLLSTRSEDTIFDPSIST